LPDTPGEEAAGTVGEIQETADLKKLKKTG
jgi:hypothetical protein